MFRLVVAGSFFAVLAYLSSELSRHGGPLAAVWLPNALAVAYLLRARQERLGPFMLALWVGNFTANLLHGDPLAKAGVFALANGIEILAACLLTRRLTGPRPDMRDISHLLRFIFAAVLCAPALSTLIAGLAISTMDPEPISQLARWAASDALAMAIIAPASLIFADAFQNPRRPGRAETVEWLILTLSGGAVTLAVFSQNRLPLLFLVPPVVIIHAFRLGSVGTAFSTLTVASIAIVQTSMGRGPMHLLEYPADTITVILEGFLASAFLCGLPTAATLHARSRLTAELAGEKQRLALLADNIADAILHYDLDGKCTYGSPSVRKVLGCTPESLVGARMSDVIHPETAELIASAEGRLSRGETETERIVYRRPTDDGEGQPVHIEADCAIARDACTGRADGMVVCARDISDRVRLERQLGDARERAEGSDRAKSRFLAEMSHEIRTPMNGVVGFAELLQRSDLSPDLARYANFIAHSGRSMMAVLNDILDISKIETGEINISERAVNIRRVLEECISLHRASIDEKGLELTVALNQNMPANALTDPLRLHQIVGNLLSNAIRFTAKGGIGVSLDFLGDTYVVSITDTGDGRAQEQTEDTFDRFARADGKTLRHHGGSGLGLTISRQLAERLGGTIETESAPGLGSCFRLRLPYRPAKVAQRAERRQHLVDPEYRANGQRRVLLVEDHDIDRAMIRKMLATCNLAVDTARDGNEGVDLVLDAEHAERPYDLVLMDLQMPGCDGYEATRAIRIAGLSREHLPVIAVTANIHADQLSAARKAGMQGHLAKPVLFEELSAMLNRWLPHRIVGEDRDDPRGTARVEARWRERRQRALEAAREALSDDELRADRTREIASIMRKLAGSAGMFGENELGQHAALLEHALRSGAGRSLRRRLAKQLLEAA